MERAGFGDSWIQVGILALLPLISSVTLVSKSFTTEPVSPFVNVVGKATVPTPRHCKIENNKNLRFNVVSGRPCSGQWGTQMKLTPVMPQRASLGVSGDKGLAIGSRTGADKKQKER